MRLRLDRNVMVENLRGYPQELVEKLRGLVAEGVEAQADPKRQGFYDVKEGGRVYFIHISPRSGRVILLASWREEAPPPAVEAERGGALAAGVSPSAV